MERAGYTTLTCARRIERLRRVRGCINLYAVVQYGDNGWDEQQEWCTESLQCLPQCGRVTTAWTVHPAFAKGRS